VCYYRDKKRHMKRHCLKKKADDAKGNKKPSGGCRDGTGGGVAPPCAALAYATLAAQAGQHKTFESLSGMSTWVLESGATSHMAAGLRALPSRRRGAGPRSLSLTVTRCPSRGMDTSPWTWGGQHQGTNGPR